ncbi:MAG: serine hydrolase [Jaaginema sp. PMC 1079.18]|nr:serine hydrolase [Jaaginema sp. PMC 1080.18]MEC4849973.1 serine hydrolase [Jaaginema sp. PMC 1079.18]MEC4866932.1 serine hydrolase [Jaaginema sp. PMC 1078.18]
MVLLSFFNFKKTTHSTPSKPKTQTQSSRPHSQNSKPLQRHPKRPPAVSGSRRSRPKQTNPSTSPTPPPLPSMGSDRRPQRLPRVPSQNNKIAPLRRSRKGNLPPNPAPPVSENLLPKVSRVTSGATTPKSLPGSVGLLSPPLLYILRLLIVGVGLGAIVGTLLSAFNAPLPSTSTQTQAKADSEAVTPSGISSLLPLKQESTVLKQKIEALAAQYPNLELGALLVDIDTGMYVDIRADQSFAAASTIKLPVLIAFFQAVDSDRLSLDEKLTMREDLIAGEAGTMQYQQPGTQFTAFETVKKMIEISDNTATNIAIDRLGGAEKLNPLFQSWGLKSTVIHNLLPDVEGTNTTSPKDLAELMATLNQGKLMSPRSRDRVLDIMQSVKTNSLLPQGLGKEATIAHKTGNIGSLVADAGIIDTPTGKRYIAVVMVKRPRNDPKAIQLIQEISRTTYEYFNAPTPQPSESPTTPNVTKTPFPIQQESVATGEDVQ